MSELKLENINIQDLVDPVKEVINGKTYIIVNTSFAHSFIVKELRDIFFLYFYNNRKECQVYTEGLNVYLVEDDDVNYVIPDIVVICGDIKIKGNGYKGVPELIVEVLSNKTRKKDKVTKFLLYERVGVKEYWIIDPKRKTAEQYVLRNGRYFLELPDIFDEEEIEEDSTIIESMVFKDMKVDFSNIFKNI
ncbi:MAG: Uma2 family endonuclease [Oscillospiraceae bacterium]|nr:Uma2 family endonuclease [Oscillospiraceae bacterium]